MKTFGMKTVIHFGDNALDRDVYKRQALIAATTPVISIKPYALLMSELLQIRYVTYQIFGRIFSTSVCGLGITCVATSSPSLDAAALPLSTACLLYTSKDLPGRMLHAFSVLHAYHFHQDKLSEGIRRKSPSLGAQFHIPHGRANAMLLPHIVEFNANINKRSRSQKTYLPAVERYASVAHILGLSNYNQVMRCV